SPLRDRIITPGFVSDGELKWLYEHARCYVLPSESEGFGLPGLEAMAHGCPVASSDATCLPEVYADAAVYFDPHDVENIAHIVGGLLDSPVAQKQLVRLGKQRLTQYSWQTMTEQIHELMMRYCR
ncbi:glycosyltransferase, partial [Candidatus Saccharibacteria bacterium]|nr:glycosyltransferase [Candidatus Saccharibacteria bacterium]